MRRFITFFAVAGMVASPALAESNLARPAPVLDFQPSEKQPVTIDVELMAGSSRLWSGSLRLGAPHGNASYSQSKNEYAEPCARDPYSGNTSSNQNLRLYINRTYSQQEPDQFTVNVNWVRPVSECEGGGTNTLGLQRRLSLDPGRTVTVSGEGGLTVKLTRQPG